MALIILILVLPLAAMPFTDNSHYEKRVLSKIPSIIDHCKLNSEFPRQFESYFNDNYGFRVYFTTAYSYLAYMLFNSSFNEKVIPGKDAFLFFNKTMDDYIRSNVLSENEILRLHKTLLLQQEYLESKGIRYIFTVAPNKNTIYGEYMPDKYIQGSNQSNLEKFENILDNSRLNYVDIKQLLLSEKNSSLLYHKTDTHWNNHGALIAFNAIMSKTEDLLPGFVLKKYDILQQKERIDFSPDLGQMLLPAFNIKDMQLYYNQPEVYVFDKPIKTYEDLEINTSKPNGKYRLLVFRDSFCNALIPFISNNFEKVRYKRAVPYYYSDIFTEQYDMVINEIAERSLPSLLEQAPIIPTLVTELDIDESPAISDENIVYHIKDYKNYIQVYGYFKLLNSGCLPEIYIAIKNQDETKYYPTYPILEKSIKDAQSEQYSNRAFSVYLDRFIIQNENSEIHLILKYNGIFYMSNLLVMGISG